MVAQDVVHGVEADGDVRPLADPDHRTQLTHLFEQWVWVVEELSVVKATGVAREDGCGSHAMPLGARTRPVRRDACGPTPRALHDPALACIVQQTPGEPSTAGPQQQ